MNAKKGYFSLVQYCPDFARQEAANVGVVLFCPELRFIKAKMVKNNYRIRRFFGEEADNYQHLNAMKDALASRLEIEKSDFVSVEDLQTFVSTRANKVVLTDPKPVKVMAPLEDLEALFQELVVEPTLPLSIQSALPLRRRMDEVFMREDVKMFMRTGIKVSVPTLNEEMDIPYGYQNGRLNLIQPMQFTQQSKARVKNAACKTAMEGLSLYRHGDAKLGSLQLVVVAEFIGTEPNTASLVREIFHEGSVRMFTPENLEDLRQDILNHGKPVPSGSELF